MLSLSSTRLFADDEDSVLKRFFHEHIMHFSRACVCWDGPSRGPLW